MNALEKFTREYDFTISPRILYAAISTPEGLSRWFADLVLLDGDVFSFKWEGSEQKARLVHSKDNEFVRFLWLDDFHQGHHLEMQIVSEPMYRSVALVVTDYAEASELDLSQRIWDAQIKKLQRLFNA